MDTKTKTQGTKIIIVGGGAGGASCAARLRRLDENAQIIMIERGPYVSYANCGLPYYVGGVIPKESSLLVANEATFRSQFEIDVRTRCEAVAIDPSKKTVDLKNVETGEVTTESYDKLVLSPGAASIRPPLPGIDLPGIFQVRTVPDVRAVTCRSGQRAYLATRILLQHGFKARNLSGEFLSRAIQSEDFTHAPAMRATCA